MASAPITFCYVQSSCNRLLHPNQPGDSNYIEQLDGTEWNIQPVGLREKSVQNRYQTNQTQNYLVVKIQTKDNSKGLSIYQERSSSQSQESIDRWEIKKYEGDCPIGKKLGWQPFLICAEGNKGVLTVTRAVNSNPPFSLSVFELNSIREGSLWFICRSEKRTYTIRNVAFGVLLQQQGWYSASLHSDRLSYAWEFNEGKIDFLWGTLEGGTKSFLLDLFKESNKGLLRDQDRFLYGLEQGKLQKFDHENQRTAWKVSRCSITGYDLDINSYPETRQYIQISHPPYSVASSERGIEELARNVFYLNEDRRVQLGEDAEQRKINAEQRKINAEQRKINAEQRKVIDHLWDRIEKLEDSIGESQAASSSSSSSSESGSRKRQR